MKAPRRSWATREASGEAKPRTRRAPDADAAKDERLLAAFGEAVAAAVQGLANDYP